MMTPSSLPRLKPQLRWSLDGLPRDAVDRQAVAPVLAEGRLFLRSRPDEAWAAFDLPSGKVVARAPLRLSVLRCSSPAMAPDGRVAVLVFQSLTDGFSLEEYAADGSHRWSLPVPLEYATEEGPTPADMGLPDYPEGPGAIDPPHPGADGMWSVCAEKWKDANAPWMTIAVRGDVPQVRWTRHERLLAATSKVGFFHGHATHAEGVDLISCTSRWRTARGALTSSTDVVLAGDTVGFRGGSPRQLAVLDANSGAVRFRARARTHRESRFLLSGEHVLYWDIDGTLETFALNGSCIGRGTCEDRVAAFDGARLLALSASSVVCRLASAPDATLWTIDSLCSATEANFENLAIAAEDGYLVLCDRKRGALSVFGPA